MHPTPSVVLLSSSNAQTARPRQTHRSSAVWFSTFRWRRGLKRGSRHSYPARSDRRRDRRQRHPKRFVERRSIRIEVAKLIYSALTSLDGYIAVANGNFDWAAPDSEVHAFVNDLERPVGTYLYGRRMYDVMVYWEAAHTLPDQPPVIRDFAELWQAADKIVFSKTLGTVSSARTR